MLSNRWNSLGSLALPLALLLSGCASRSDSSSAEPEVETVETLYLAARDLADELDVAEARDAKTGDSGREVAELERRYARALPAARRALKEISPRDPGDALAVARMRAALQFEVRAPADGGSSASSPAAANRCREPAEIVALPGGSASISAALYHCFGERATRIEHDGETLDRLTVFARLAEEPDSSRRRALFLSFLPLWRAIDGDPESGAHPYRELVRRSAAEWSASGSPVDRQIRDLGLDPRAFESDLEAILEAWREAFGNESIEPWDLHWQNGEAARRLRDRVPREQLEEIHRRYYADLGADPAELGVRYDLAPRAGKTPVAFCTFGRRGRHSGSNWKPTQPWVFATYRTGGFDNLVELLHETGHAIHLAGIRTRPAYLDWPDSDAFTEGLGDLLALEAYEPEWQERYLATSIPLGIALRSKYGAIALDIAWTLFELRLYREPELPPNRIWSELTERYFGVRPHPELSWWALRGQLVSSPGYIANYAIGAVIVADLRAEAKRRRGAFSRPDAAMYAWLSDELYRPGRELPSRAVIERFLGRPPSGAALLADLARASISGEALLTDGSVRRVGPAESRPANYLRFVSSTSAK